MDEQQLPSAAPLDASVPSEDPRAPFGVRVVRIATGSSILAAGLLMLVLPGPGLVAIAAGLGLLSKDIPAAARLLRWLRNRIPGAQRAEQLPRGAIVATLSGTLAFSVIATWFLAAN